jgi:hypothetical protein
LCLNTFVVDSVQLLKVSVFENVLNFSINKAIEFLGGRLFKVVKLLIGPFEVLIAHLIIDEHLSEAVFEGLLLSLNEFMLVEVFSGRLNGESTVTEIDSFLAKGLLQLGVKVFSHLWLGSAVFVDPKTNLISEFLIVETCRK